MPSKTPKPLFNLIILGDPGAGKATQSAIIAKKYKMRDFDMGRELTLLRQKDAKFNAILNRTSDKGNLTPTDYVRAINKKAVLSTPASTGILFDGHPKMLGEAKQIAQLLKLKKRTNPLVLYIRIPASEIIRRTNKRHGYYKTKFSKRPDDTESALRNRAKYYKKNIAAVVKFFKSKYEFHYVDGMGSKSAVEKKVNKKLDKFLKNAKVY